MNLADTNRLLTFIVLYDNRRIDDAVVVAWHAIVAKLPLDACMAAVTKHFAESTEYLMPAHIMQTARQIARENQRPIPEITPPENLVPLKDRSPEIVAFVRSHYAALPPGKPELIRRPRIADAKRGRKAA